MKIRFVGAAATAAALAFVTGASAGGAPQYCGIYAAPTIVAPTDEGGAACQAAISKNTQKYVKSLLKTRGKCLLAGEVGACPNTDDDEKVQKAATKSADGIAKKCTATTGLGSSYAGVTAANVASCTLSQTHGTAEIYLGETHGPSATALVDNEAFSDCQAAIDKAAQKLLPAQLKAVTKCIDGSIKAGETTGLGAACVGSVNGATFTAPTNEKAAEGLTKAAAKSDGSIDKACSALTADQISALLSCPGATTLADLQACAECSGINAMHEIVGQIYSETGTLVTANIQAAVDAASTGDKLLIASGDYAGDVDMPPATCAISALGCTGDEDCMECGPFAVNAGDPCDDDGDCTGDTCQFFDGNECESDGDDMQLVGCGAATDDRPVILPIPMSLDLQGIVAAGVDGLHFQALEVRGWENDGIFVTGANGVSIRDLVGDGDNLATANVDSISTYAVFPVESSNVTVEGTEVYNVRDAGIYVGSAVGIVVRHNVVHENVTGIEIENSDFADVYGNDAFGNTGGILSFKLPGPAKQTSGNHHFFDNVSHANNTPNFAIPGSTVAAVIPGTGFMILSEDDSTFENNVVESNGSYGMLILDQEAVNVLVDPDPFVPTSVDQDSENLVFLHNRLPGGGATKNGEDPDVNGLFANNYTMALNGGTNGTCFDPVPDSGEREGAFGETFDLCP